MEGLAAEYTDYIASALGTQYMAAASISSAFHSRSALGLPPSIPLTVLDHSRLRFRAITTESQRPTESNPPPIPQTSQREGTKIATKPPLQAVPPTPPLPVSSIPPKIAEVAAEKVQKEVAKKEEKPKGSLPSRAWAKVKEEASHYWHGTKLLGQEIKISAKLQYKVLQGSTLTRRERRQVSLDLNAEVYRSFIAASTYNDRLATIDSILAIRSHSIHGVFATCSIEAVPQHASIHIRGRIRSRKSFGHYMRHLLTGGRQRSSVNSYESGLKWQNSYKRPSEDLVSRWRMSSRVTSSSSSSEK